MLDMSVCQSHSRRGIILSRVIRNIRLCHEHYQVTLRAQGLPPSRSGQFVQIQCRGQEEQVTAREIPWPGGAWPRAAQPELTDREPMLRRPLSLAARRELADGASEIDIIYRTIGAGTNWLAGCKSGDTLSVLGPLGNGFTLRPEKPFAALVGGGVGIPPMLYLAQEINTLGKAAVAFVGARSGSLLPMSLAESSGKTIEPAADGRPTPCLREFNAFCTDAAVATDDGSLGYRGLVSEAFILWLADHDFDPRDVVVYCCGPEPMERAIADLCLMRGIECQVSLERHMACGVGTCQSCVVKIRNDEPAACADANAAAASGQGGGPVGSQNTDAPPGWSFKLCCTDGPVFDASEVLW